MSQVFKVVNVSGISNSGPTHWQSRWEKIHSDVTRVMQADWENPACDLWAAQLDAHVRSLFHAPIIVGHSLGCLVVARWLERYSPNIRGALLVAVPDPSGPNFPEQAIGFEDIPAKITGYRIKILSSSNDPYSTASFSDHVASCWNAQHLKLGDKGHLNASSGLGDWQEGWHEVQSF
jgi:uncharacterized protein